MKKSIYLIAAALLLSLSSQAQQQNDKADEAKQAPTAEQMAKWQADRMKQQYLLGNDQYDKVYKLCLKRAEKQIARQNEMKKEQQQMNAEMKKILNETQYERYEQNQNRPQHMMRPGMQHRGRFQQQGAWNRQGQWQGQWQRQAPMQMPPQQFQPGPQINKQTQQQARRRPAMYDDTRKLSTENAKENSTTQAENK